MPRRTATARAPKKTPDSTAKVTAATDYAPSVAGPGTLTARIIAARDGRAHGGRHRAARDGANRARMRRGIVGGCALGLAAGWNIANTGAIATQLASAYGVGLAVVGLFTTALFATHIAFQIPGGRLERPLRRAAHGPRRARLHRRVREPLDARARGVARDRDACADRDRHRDRLHRGQRLRARGRRVARRAGPVRRVRARRRRRRARGRAAGRELARLARAVRDRGRDRVRRARPRRVRAARPAARAARAASTVCTPASSATAGSTGSPCSTRPRSASASRSGTGS